MKVAIVYDRVNKWGGAERVLLALHKIFPDAPIFTSVYDEKGANWSKGIEIKKSFLQFIPKATTSHEFLAPLMPLAFESFNFQDFDLVVSVTSEAAKGIITNAKTLHICICLTPTRYLWSGYDEYFKNKILRFLAKPILSYLKNWDLTASARPNEIIAISKNVQKRVKNYYGRDSKVIYPPLMIENTATEKLQGQEYFLVVSRLVPYKRIDIAIDAFNKLGKNLIIVGTGRGLGKLKSKARKNIKFLGSVSDKDLALYYKNAQALIFPGIEDFGLVMAEAQYFGTPVIAFRGGGAEEILLEGKTGVFFDKQNYSSLLEILEKFDKKMYNSENCKKNAERFLFSNFEKELKNFINDKIK